MLWLMLATLCTVCLPQIWDAGGQKDCDCLGTRFWGRAAGIVLIVRDLAELKSWHENLTSWLDVGQKPVIAVLWQLSLRSTPGKPQVCDLPTSTNLCTVKF